MDHDVGIVGGGAAGLMTAITAARAAPALRIAVFEGRPRPGIKILVSGGGRCNVTNADLRPGDFHGDRARIARVLRRFPQDATVGFFESLGVPLKQEPEFGKLFPESDSAHSVLDALLAECARLRIDLRLGSRVESASEQAGSFVVAGPGGSARCESLVLATGGRSLPKSGSDGGGYALARSLGHSVSDTSPALVPLVLDPHPFAGLAGISFPAEVQAWVGGRLAAAERGPALVTHFGLSGPSVMNASRHFSVGRSRGETPEMRMSFFPGRKPEQLEAEWLAAAKRDRGRRVASLFRELPARIAKRLCEIAELPLETRLAALPRDARRRLLEAATALRLPVVDTRGWNAAEVTAGGVPLSEVDVRRMASRLRPGLFLVGEILDVDGRIGGFNFQWAWATGFVAGEALALAAG